METSYGLAAAVVVAIIVAAILARGAAASGGPGKGSQREQDKRGFVPQPLPHPQTRGLTPDQVDANRQGAEVDPHGAGRHGSRGSSASDAITGQQYARARAAGWGRRSVYGTQQGYGDRWGMREYSLGAPGEVGADVGPLGSGYSVDRVHKAVGETDLAEVFGVAETLKYVPRNPRPLRLRDTDEFNTAHIDLAAHLTTGPAAGYALYEADVDHYDPESQGPRVPHRDGRMVPLAPRTREPDHDPLVGAAVVNHHDPATPAYSVPGDFAAPRGEPMHSDATRGSLLPAHA